MKKILSSLLSISLLTTVTVSAAQPSISTSVPMNRQSMQAVVGGADCSQQVEPTEECANYVEYELTYEDEQGNIFTKRGGFWCSFGIYSWEVWMGVAIGFSGLTAGASVIAATFVTTVGFATSSLLC